MLVWYTRLMSFLSVVEKIWHGITVGVNAAEPYASQISAIPIVGAPASIIINSIFAAERLVPTSGNGAAKKAAVTALANAASPGIPPATLSTAIDELVSALNALSSAAAKLPATIPAPQVPAA
jgi:hypothetical protein